MGYYLVQKVLHQPAVMLHILYIPPLGKLLSFLYNLPHQSLQLGLQLRLLDMARQRKFKTAVCGLGSLYGFRCHRFIDLFTFDTMALPECTL